MVCKILRFKPMGRILTSVAVLAAYHQALMAQENAPQDATPGLHLKHILGFESLPKNAEGDLSIQDGYVRFRTRDHSTAEISVDSIQQLGLGEQDKQVGGIPMMLAKTAAPYESGRVISLFSHKKYDTLTLEYIDSNGALHGAIFQMDKGNGKVLKGELEAAGAHVASLHSGDQK